MIFGSKDSLAIEVEKESDEFCRLCLWINNRLVGDYDNVVLAGALVESLSRFTLKKELRDNRELFFLEDSVLVDRIIDSVFGDDDISLEESLLLLEKYGSFVFSPGVSELFDEDAVVVVSHGDKQRVVWKSFIDDDKSEVIVKKGCFEKIINSCVSFLG